MDGVRKDASVGEYDARSGLTHVTRQRGRLLFNMGASARKQRRQQQQQQQQEQQQEAPPPPRAVNPESAASSSVTSRLTTGAFTGLSLYPEEALYLVQRGALAVFLIADNRPLDAHHAGPLDAAAFLSLLVRHQRVSLACLDVYAFLKGEKLHPRRCLSTSHDDDKAAGAWGQRRAPQHLGGAHAPCSVAFDVWRSVAAPSLPAGDATSAPSSPAPAAAPPPAPGSSAAKPAKRLQLVFRVLVARFDDPPSRPQLLRKALMVSQAEYPGVPVKLAVVSRDHSVLLLELAAP